MKVYCVYDPGLPIGEFYRTRIYNGIASNTSLAALIDIKSNRVIFSLYC